MLEDRLAPAQLVVTSPLDPASLTPGTLRAAVNQANTDANLGISDTILFNTAQMGTSTITLSHGPLVYSSVYGSLLINGGGQVAVSGNNASAVFEFTNGATAGLTGLTIEQGNASSGGGVEVGGSANVTLTADTVTGNTGGGIYNDGTLTLSDDTISGNTGGGLINVATAMANGIDVSANSAGTGGGIDNSGGYATLTLSNSLVTGNDASLGFCQCGGIDNASGTLVLQHTLVAGNFPLFNSIYGAPDVSGVIAAGSAWNLIGDGYGMSGISSSDGNHNLVGTPSNPLGLSQGSQLASFTVSAPATALAGVGSGVTVTARDAAGNLVLGYTGLVTLTANGGQLLSPAMVLLIGGSTTTTVALGGTGPVTLTASAGTATGSSGSINLTNQITVTTASDAPGHQNTSLRDAVVLADAAAANGASDTIVFNTAQMGGNTITLTQGPLMLSGLFGTVTINGGGQVAVSGNNASGVFTVNTGAQAALTGLTIENGHAGWGGGVWNNGTLTLSGDTFLNNSTYPPGLNVGYGGAVDNGGVLTVIGSTFIDNTSYDGGAISNGGPMFLFGSLTLVNDTFTGNAATAAGTSLPSYSAAPAGGAIYNWGSALTVEDCTVYGNTSTGTVGGIDNAGGGFTGRILDPMILQGTIVAGDTAASGGPDVSGPVATGSSHNLIGNGAGMTGLSNGDAGQDLVGSAASPINPLLAALGNNGGPTQTFAPLAGSPALGAGLALPGVTTDQRGLPRTASPDIGAYQTQPVATFAVTAPAAAIAGAPFSVSVKALDAAGNPIPSYHGVVTLTASDGQAVYPSAVTLTNGVATASVFLDQTDTLTLTATAGTAAGASGTIAVTNQIIVTTASDAPTHTGTSLRDAVALAGAAAGNGVSDNIVFNTSSMGGSVITLAQGALEIKAGAGVTTINGGGQVVVNGNHAGSDFQIDQGASAVLNGLTIENGVAGSGGGIDTYGTLTVSNSTLTGDTATALGIMAGGGAIYNTGALVLTGDTLSGDTETASTLGKGGALWNGGTATVTNTTFTGDSVTGPNGEGGAVYNSGTLTVSASTFQGNTTPGAYGDGGALYNFWGMVTLNAVTITHNTAAYLAGGIDNLGNTANLTLQGTTVAGNAAGNACPDVDGTVAAGSGNNLIGSGNGVSGITNADANGNVVGVQAFAVAPNGNLLWLTPVASGSWLETKAPGSGAPQFMATDIGAFAIDGAGDVLALDGFGNLERFLPSSVTPQAAPLAAGVGSFGVDASGSVAVLLTNGTLERFAAGSTTAQNLATNVSRFVLDGSGAVVAYEPQPYNGPVSITLGNAGSPATITDLEDANLGVLVRFAPGSTAGQTLATNVAQFGVDASGSVAASFLPELAYFGGIAGFYSGITSAVSNQAASELAAGGTASFLVTFAPGVTQGTAVNPTGLSVSQLFVDAAGSDWIEDQNGNLYRYDPVAQQLTDVEAVKAVTLDVSGSVVVVDNNGNLARFIPGTSTSEAMASGATALMVDGAGSLLAFQPTASSDTGAVLRFAPGATTAEASYANVSHLAVDGDGTAWMLSGNVLNHYAGGSTTSMLYESGVQAFVVDASGSVVALQTTTVGPISTSCLLRFAPGSNDAADFDTGAFKEIAVDGSGAVVVLESPAILTTTTGGYVSLGGAGNVIRFAPGSTVGQVLDTNNVSSFVVDGDGQVVALEGGGTLVRFLPNSTNWVVMNYDPNSWTNVNGNNFTVLGMSIDAGCYVIAVTSQQSSTGPLANLVYFAPGSTTPQHIVVGISQFGVLASGSMLALQGGNHSLYKVPASVVNLPATLSPVATNVQSFTIGSDGLSYTITPVSSSPWKVLEVVGEIVGAGLVTYLSAGTLGPAVAALVTDVGLSSDALVAGAIGSAVAAATSAAVTQGINSLAFGTSFNVLNVLTSGLTSGLGGLGGLNTLLGNVLDANLAQAAGSLVTQALSGKLTLSSAATTALSALASESAPVLGSLSFVQDATSFFNQVSADLANLGPIGQDGLNFLGQAATGLLAGKSLNKSLAMATASVLNQTLASNLGNTPFAAGLGSLLNAAANGKLSTSTVLQAALPVLEQTVAGGLAGTAFGNQLATVLTQIANGGNFLQAASTLLQQAASSLGATPLSQDVGAFLNQASSILGNAPFGTAVGTILQQAASGNLNSQTLLSDALPALQDVVNANLGGTPLGTTLGNLLSQAASGSLTGAGLLQSVSPLLQQAAAAAQGGALGQDLGSLLNQLADTTLGNTTLGAAAGTLLQQAASGSLNASTLLSDALPALQDVVNANLGGTPLGTALGNLLSQAASGSLTGAALLQSVSPLLQQAAAVVQNSALGQDLGPLLNQLADTTLGNTTLGNGVGALLSAAASGNLTSTLLQSALSVVQDALAADLGNTPIGQTLGALVAQAAGGSLSSPGFLQSAGSLVEQLASATLISSGFGQDLAAFMNQSAATILGDNSLGAAVGNLLQQAVISPSVSGLVQTALPTLEQTVVDNLAETAFGTQLGSMLADLGSGTEAAPQFLQDAGALLQQTIAANGGPALVQDVGGLLGQEAAAVLGDTALATEVGGFLNQAVAADPSTAAFTQGAVTFLTQAVADAPALESIAQGVVTALQQTLSDGLASTLGQNILSFLANVNTAAQADLGAAQEALTALNAALATGPVTPASVQSVLNSYST
jgi:hypothetical protein